MAMWNRDANVDAYLRNPNQSQKVVFTSSGLKPPTTTEPTGLFAWNATNTGFSLLDCDQYGIGESWRAGSINKHSPPSRRPE
jgi:hypothetical protein